MENRVELYACAVGSFHTEFRFNIFPLATVDALPKTYIGVVRAVLVVQVHIYIVGLSPTSCVLVGIGVLETGYSSQLEAAGDEIIAVRIILLA